MTEKQLTIQDVPTDGNCFFWALSHQLDEHGSNGFTQQQLRRMLVEYLAQVSKDHPGDVEPFLTETLADYIKRMGQNGEYADNSAVHFSAKMLGAKIRVAERESEREFGGVDGTPELTVGYISQSKHYVSLSNATSSSLQLDDYVAVELEGRKGNKHVYIATITAIDGSDSVEVSYMREEVTSTTSTFTWPCKRDVSTLSTCYILRKLSKPSQGPGRKLRHRFCEKELQKCVKK